MEEFLLEITDLTTEFRLPSGWYPAVDGVSLRLRRREALGIVGESGSGKTMTALSLMRLLPRNGRVKSGFIRFDGQDMLTCSLGQMRRVRGRQIAMIFQDPMSALDPVYTCGQQLCEAISAHQRMPKEALHARCLSLLGHVGIHSPEKFMAAYPHELSGGMCQRVMIAMALALNPMLLIADEPTTALDVTVQAMILTLLKSLRAQHDMSLLLISHDLGVVADIADRVMVMYGGHVVETGETALVFNHPRHPYTQGLIASVPRLDGGQTRLASIEGVVPDIEHFPSGCRFSNRCPYADARCRTHRPAMAGDEAHATACWNVNGREGG